MELVRSRILAACAASTVTALVIGGIAWAAVPTGTTGSIWGCYRLTAPSKGALRIVDHQAGRGCRADEALLAWPSRGFRWRGTWNNSTAYAPNDVIAFHGSTYIATRPTTNVLPSSAAYWTLMASAGVAGQAGTPGATGGTGPQGTPGATGGTGPQGPQGVQGNPGGTGAQGNPGATGGTGPQGSPGTPGTPGATGGTGPQGNPGATGGTGPSGVALCGGYPHTGIDWSVPGSTPGNGCNLTGANLTNANLTNANLTSANLAGATFTGANVTGVLWSNTTCPDSTNSGTNGSSPESCVGHL
jgi:hypothetical protein